MNKKEDILRDWLVGMHSGAGLEKKVQEAVFVLSPHRAPAPKKSIGEVFSHLRGGPLSLLPEESSSEDVSFIFSHLEDRDAIPKGSVGTVIDSLRSGPLVKKEENIASLDEHRARVEQPRPTPSWKRSWHVWGTICAAAAAVIFLVQPILNTNIMMAPQEKEWDAPQANMPYVEQKKLVEYREEEPAGLEKPRPSIVSKDAAPRKKSARPVKRKNKNSRTRSVEKEQIILADDEQALAPNNTRVTKNLEEENLVDILGVLRDAALQGEVIPRHIPFAHLDRDVLLSITQDADVDRMYWAAYELAIRYPKERIHIESLLRLKAKDSLQRMYLWILLGDLYRNSKEDEQAQKAYKKAIQMRK